MTACRVGLAHVPAWPIMVRGVYFSMFGTREYPQGGALESHPIALW